MAESDEPADIDTLIDNAAWAICSTYHRVLKVSPGAAIFGQVMPFNIPFIADWKQIETICNNRQITAMHMKTASMSTLIIKLVTKY
jgi:hypothetical protein